MNKPKLKEADTTRQIRDYLKLNRIFHWKVFQSLGSEKGVADIVGIYLGKPLAIEVKTAKGKLSEHQAKWLDSFREAGGIAFVARSVDDVERELREAVSPVG